MQHGESTNWRRRANAERAKAGPELTGDAHEVEEGQVSGLGRHRPQLPLPQHELRRVQISEHKKRKKTRGEATKKRTAIVRTGSEGWKLLGPSSQRYPSSGRSTVVMFPQGGRRLP